MNLETSVLIYLKTKKGPQNITASLSEYLESVRYTDKIENEVDELEIQLNDSSGIWSGAWFPKQGDQLKAIFKTSSGLLFCGTFNIDSLSVSCPPSIFRIKALAVPFGNEMRRTKKNKAWEECTLQEIAAAICAEANLKLKFETTKNPYYIRVDQKRESNAEFLQRLCKEASLAMKMTATSLCIFSREEKEKKAVIKIIYKTNFYGTIPGSVMQYDFQTQLSDSAKSAKVSYFDPKTGETNTYKAEDQTADKGAQDLKLVKRAKSKEEAKRLAEAELKKKNQQKKSGNIRLIGDITLYAGQNIFISGFGAFDGKYTIEESSHQLTEGGYTTQIRITNTEPASNNQGANKK